MKHGMSLLLITGLFFCMAALQASAQRHPMPTPEERTKQLTDSLALNKDQAAKVLAIYQDTDKKRQEIFNSNSEDRDTMRAAMRDLMDKTDKNIEAQLTVEQKAKYEEMKAQRMKRMQQYRGPDSSR